ncbi:MAG: DNA double-strand break repair nuclease NurA [Armatimonadetes bacterium]|nr:DNA double-strand break repair nuclease NurA [Armatimonadota bacterium]
MLDLLKVAPQMEEMIAAKAGTGREIGEAIAEADRRLLEAAGSVVKTHRSIWLEKPDTAHPLPEAPPEHIVLATDGSQIDASRHEAAFCSLVNIGSVFLVYGTGERPQMASIPLLLHRPDDLFVDYDGKKAPLVDKLLAARRTIEEVREMTRLIRMARERNLPAVALIDGPLIFWMFAEEPKDFRATILSALMEMLDAAQQSGVPVAGYISDPSAREIIEVLEFEPVKEGLFAEERPSLAKISDAALFHRRLKPGERSALFRGTSPVLNAYGGHRICFTYLRVEREIVRLEVPQWVAGQKELLDRVHAIACDQAQKGKGYPPALTEAHERAVVRGAERDRFFGMVENAFIKNGLPLRWSAKSAAKKRASV